MITSLPEGLEVEAGIEMHAERAGADRFWHWPPRVVRRGRLARRGRQIKRYSRSLQTYLQTTHQHRTQFAQPCIVRDGLQMFETETAKFNGVSHIAGIVAGDVQQQPCWRVMVSVKDMVDEAIGEFGVCCLAMVVQQPGRPEKYHSRAEIISLPGDGFQADGNGFAHLEAPLLHRLNDRKKIVEI